MNKPAEDWDWKGIRGGFLEHFATKSSDVEHLHDPEQIAKALFAAAEKKFQEKEKEMGTELLLRVFRHFYLEEIDRQWVDHLTNMEHLRDGIGLRGYGQRDPKREYEGGLRRLHDDDGGDHQQRSYQALQVQVRKENEIERIEREDAEKHALSSKRCRCGTA
jgi:preprotein translocase subunit SecA